MVARRAVASEFRVRIPALSFFRLLASLVNDNIKKQQWKKSSRCGLFSGWSSFSPFFYFLFFVFYLFLFFIFLFFIFYFFTFYFFVFLFFLFVFFFSFFFYFFFIFFLFFYFFIFYFFLFFIVFVFHFFVFYFLFFYFFNFIFFYFFIFYFFIYFFRWRHHPPHPPLPSFFFSFPPTPPLLFLFFAHPPLSAFFLLPSRTLADAFRRFSEDALHQSEARTYVTSASENWVARVPCVRLMRFLGLFLEMMSSFSRPKIFNNQSEARVLACKFELTNHKPPFPTVKSCRKGPTVLLLLSLNRCQLI